MLRITLVSQSGEEVVLKIEGMVAGQEVALLEEEGRRWIGQVRYLVLDLEGVEFIDREGLALLKSWSGKGLVLQGGSIYVRMLLKKYTLE